MLAADIPRMERKKKSDNLQYTATLKSRSQVPAQTAFHYLPLVDYVKNFFFQKGNLLFLLKCFHISEGYLNCCIPFQLLLRLITCAEKHMITTNILQFSQGYFPFH